MCTDNVFTVCVGINLVVIDVEKGFRNLLSKMNDTRFFDSIPKDGIASSENQVIETGKVRPLLYGGHEVDNLVLCFSHENIIDEVDIKFRFKGWSIATCNG